MSVKASLEIKKCPFCGGEAVVCQSKSYTGRTYYYVVCGKCRTEQGKTYSTKQYAIKIWNRRTNSDD